MRRIKTHTNLNPEYYKELQKMAKALDIPAAILIRQAVMEYIDEYTDTLRRGQKFDVGTKARQKMIKRGED